jgi:hypothetical protein
MAKNSEAPPTNIVEATPEQDAPEHWPSLDSPGTKNNEEWEMVPPEPTASAQVTFDVDAIHITNENPRCLKHCQSLPDFLNYQVEEDDSEEESAVMIEDSSMMSASVVMVPSPNTLNSSFAKVSFKDAILSKSDHLSKQNDAALLNGSEPKQSKLRKVKPKFVVTPIKRCVRSTGDLKTLGRQMNDDDDVLGDSDAHEFYSRKAHGSATRQNGMKTRPDEAKRLQITMAKKNLQRERQQARKG